MSEDTKKRSERIIKSLTSLQSRYLFKSIAFPNGQHNHLAGCSIHQPIDIYGWCACTCGLLDDLDWDARLGSTPRIVSKIFPNYCNDSRHQHCQGGSGPSKEQIAENRKVLEKAFPGFSSPKPEHYWDEVDEKGWELISEVFAPEVVAVMKERWLKLPEEDR